MARRLTLLLLASLLALATVAPVGAQPVAPTTPARPLTYVAMGASDAVGVGATDPAREGWVPQLAARLGPNTRLVNLGVDATTLRQAIEQQLPAALAADPDVVTVWLAVNDFNAGTYLLDYLADLDYLLSTLQTKTRARVLVGNVPDLTLVRNYAHINPRLLRFGTALWNVAIRDSARLYGATLVDLYRAWPELAANPDYVSADGFHPSSQGYARLADYFFTTYSQAPAPAQLTAAAGQ